MTSRLTWALSIGVVVATLGVALAGLGEVRASRRATDAAQRGQRLAVESMSALLRTNQAAQVDVENFRRARDQRARAGNSLQRGLFADARLAASLRLEQQRRKRLAAAAEALTPLRLDSDAGPRADPRFPSVFFAKRTSDALRLQALQDAANEERASWDARSSAFTAALTLSAVVVYLFGFALALPERLMRVFGVAGSVLLVLGAAFAARTALDSPDPAPREAAAEFTKGFVGLETATERGGFLEARTHFTRSVELWPSFGRGYVGRALATLRAEAPKLNVVLLPTEALESAEADFERARGLGVDTPSVRLQLAATKFALALQGRPELFRETEALARRAIAALPSDPVPRYNLAFSLLGQERTEEAMPAFREAIARTVAADMAGTPRPPEFVQSYVSSALTDLEALKQKNPGLADEVADAKALLVASAAAGRVTEPGAGSGAPVAPLQVLLTASTLSWIASSPLQGEPGGPVSMQWYERGEGGGWVGLAEVSGPLGPGLQLPTQEARNILASSLPPRCLESKAYRVELYVEGRLAGEGEQTATLRPLTAFVDPVLNLTMCHPPEWRQAPSTLEGFRDVVTSRDGKQGAVMLRYNLTALPPRLRRLGSAALTEALLQTSVDSIRDVLPGAVTGATEVTHERYIWPDGPSQRSYAIEGGGLAFAQAGVDRGDDAAFVVLVFGPQDLFSPVAAPEESLLTVATSFSEYRYGGG